MDACNKFGESLVHLACRTSDPQILNFLLENGGSLSAVDDLGRTALHDLCWCAQPNWGLAMICLQRDWRLFVAPDNRKLTPLCYIKKHHWPYWRAFFDCVKDAVWPDLTATQTAVGHGGGGYSLGAVESGMP